tara:strand:- start:2216 stop:3253 length:1038 start_codon:yes stop_codon:yes gene_type:complete
MDKGSERLDSGVDINGELKYGDDISINYSQRNNILTVDNHSIINKFFGEAFNFSYDNPWTPGNGKAKFTISKTNKLLVLYAAKHASSFLQDLLHTKKYTEEVISTENPTQLTFNNFKSEINLTPKGNLAKLGIENAKELVKITNNESELDLIVVIRNPIYKLISGLIQDLEGQLENNYLLPAVIKNQYKIDIEDYNTIGDLPSEVAAELFYEYTMRLLIQTGTLKNHHSTLLNEATYNLLEQYSKIPKNKLKIVDVDDVHSNLGHTILTHHNEITSNWKEGLFKTHRPKWISLLTSLEKILEEKNRTHSFKQILKNYCYQDYFYYLKLKEKYKDCFVTTNTNDIY